MAERKHKHEAEELVELDSEEMGYVLKPTHVEVGSGYTVSISYDQNEKPIVDLKTYGDVDLTKLKMEVARMFQNARIRQLKQTQSVTIVKKRGKKRETRKK